MSAGWDVFILLTSAHEKFTVLAEEGKTGEALSPPRRTHTLPAEGREAVGS